MTLLGGPLPLCKTETKWIMAAGWLAGWSHLQRIEGLVLEVILSNSAVRVSSIHMSGAGMRG